MCLTPVDEVTRLDFDFHGHAGYAIARRQVDIDLPPNYQFVFRLRGETPPQNLEFKLIDASGDNVWWMNRRDFVFPREWTPIKTKKRQIGFAWGPSGGGEIRHVAAMEIVVTAGSGGKGAVWFSDPTLEPLPVVSNEPLHFTSNTMDLGERRDVGGLIIDWKEQPSRFVVRLDGVPKQHSASRFVWLPDAEGRRIEIEGGEAREVTVEPPDWAPTINDFYAIVARDARRGLYPRYLIGEQPYWTVIGADGAEPEALVGEDGNVEPFKGGFSIEPFLLIGGTLVTWADAEIAQSLSEGDLPIPTVTWKAQGVRLTMTAAVSRSSMLQLHYRLRGRATLLLAVRPFQVNPSTQFLNTTGGYAEVRTVRVEGRNLIVNGRQRVILSPLPSERNSLLPDAYVVTYHNPHDVRVNIPLEKNARAEPFTRIAADWREKLHRVAIEIPGAPAIAGTIRSNIAYTLIQRDGAAIKPGSRSYDRAWIRDGALIGSLLLRLAHARVAKEFAEWFARYQYDDGKVPCCVDRRGADPVPENDSHGELIFLVAEIHRYTGDTGFVRKLWPNIDRAARYIQKLRSENHGAFEGLLTESISHEGYSAKPVHSYWDDVFGVKGIEDAAYLAGVLGLRDRQRELHAQAASFRHDLRASIDRTMQEHHLDSVPASAELGDFDPTSTAIGISPLGLASLMPQEALRHTYDRYFESISKPREDYTPYEMRIIGALIRLGQRDRALQLIDRFLRDRRPAAWNEWAEVIGTEYRKPRFIGDMPHVWIASDFIRSILDAIAYDREDGALIAGAGVPREWIGSGTLHVGPLWTQHGTIDVRMRADGERIVVSLTGDAKPPNGIVVVSPVDGKETRQVDHLPARVVF